jgi:hypothetical protein
MKVTTTPAFPVYICSMTYAIERLFMLKTQPHLHALQLQRLKSEAAILTRMSWDKVFLGYNRMQQDDKQQGRASIVGRCQLKEIA